MYRITSMFITDRSQETNFTFTCSTFCTIICWQSMSLWQRNENDKTKKKQSTKKKKYQKCEQQSKNNLGRTITVHLLTFLSVRPQLLIHITMPHGNNLLEYLIWLLRASAMTSSRAASMAASYFRQLVYLWLIQCFNVSPPLV